MSADAVWRTLRYEVRDGVATITLDRPEQLNAFTYRMCAELLEAFDQIDADDEVRAVVVTGAGRAFCAGADLSGGREAFDPGRVIETAAAEGVRLESDLLPAGVARDGGGIVTLRIFECRKPVIAAINGHAVGFGLTITLPMDVRLVASGAKLGVVFNRRGILPDAASSWFLPRVVGISRAMEWAATGRTFGPEEALEAGLVRSVHTPEQLLPAAYALAREIADHAAPVSVALTRQLMWRMLGAADPMQAHLAESRGLHERGAGADAAEGVAAFLEKRQARFPLRVSTDLPDIFPG